jgi:chemotaxis protein methyltransferase CheR
MDLVLCRNVLIYFGDPTIRSIADRLCDSLVDGGWLLVGHAEPSQEIFHRYEVSNFPGAIVYRRPAARPSASEPAPVRPLRPVAGVPLARQHHESDPVDEARALFEAGRSGEAVKRLQELATESPKDFRAPYLLAKILASRMRFSEAERWIDVAIANRELGAEAHYLRGLVLQEQGRLEDALEAFRRCVFLDHGFALGHFAAAGLFGRSGQTLRAQKSLTTVTDLLAGKPADALLPEGDGLTVGGLMELVALQRRLVA